MCCFTKEFLFLEEQSCDTGMEKERGMENLRCCGEILCLPFALLAELNQNLSCSSNLPDNIKNKVLKQLQWPFHLRFTAASPELRHRFSLFLLPDGVTDVHQLNCLPDGVRGRVRHLHTLQRCRTHRVWGHIPFLSQ